MRKSTVLYLGFFLAALAGEAFSLGRPGGVEISFGSRIEYFLRAERARGLYPWNVSTGSDRTRLMLDLGALKPSYGTLYLKGAASWLEAPEGGGDVGFGFEQGDYCWRMEEKRSRLSFLVFANERRFFTGEMLAPLLYDDYVRGVGDNRGVRFDGRFWDKLRIVSLGSILGWDWDGSRKVSYAQTAFSHRLFSLSASYLYDIPGGGSSLRHAVFKGELSWFYRSACFILSYEQSGFGSGGLFFPTGTFHTNRFVGDNFSSVLPDGGAFFAEVRALSIPFKELGRLGIVHRYFATRKDFVSDLGTRGGTRVGYVFATYFAADTVSLNARFLLARALRWKFEREEHERAEASLWGTMKNGTTFSLRAMRVRTKDSLGYVSKENFAHVKMDFHSKNLRTGFNMILKDVGTTFSSRMYAWDSRFVFNTEFAMDLRFVLAKEFTAREAVFARLEFRPSSKIFAYLSYGRSYLGDGPFLLEDKDLSMSQLGSSVYTVSVRGDF